MDERLSFELRGHPTKDLMELTLDNAKSPDANFLRTKNFTSLKYLSMINCGLRSLAGLPALPSLKIVVLNGNRLTGDLSFLSRCDKLQYVDLSENLIGATESLAPLQWLRKLRALYLMSNPVAFVDGYRATVLNIIPSLQDLDGTDRSGKAITQSVLLKERGSEDSEAVSEMPVTSVINCVGVGNTEAMEAVMMLLQGEDPTTDKESAEANTSGLADLRQFLIL
jgi:Leucine-rich repeat